MQTTDLLQELVEELESSEGALAPEHRELLDYLRKWNSPDGSSAMPARTVRFQDYIIIGDDAVFSDLAEQGAHLFQKPEAAFKAIRTKKLSPRICIAGMSNVPKALTRSVDLRIRCPKIWTGRRAPDPELIQSYGLYQARTSLAQLAQNVEAVVGAHDALLTRGNTKTSPPLPLLSKDDGFKKTIADTIEQLEHENKLIVVSSDDLELEAAGYHLALSGSRQRVWEIKTGSTIDATYDRVKRARRLSDVSILMYPKATREHLARKSSPSFPEDCRIIYLTQTPLKAKPPLPRLELPSLQDRPKDINAWSAWFLGRFSIAYSIAVKSLDLLIESSMGRIEKPVTLSAVQVACERCIKEQVLSDREPDFISYQDRIKNFERQVLNGALEENRGNLLATARALGLAESSLRYKLRAVGITVKRARRRA